MSSSREIEGEERPTNDSEKSSRGVRRRRRRRRSKTSARQEGRADQSPAPSEGAPESPPPSVPKKAAVEPDPDSPPASAAPTVEDDVEAFRLQQMRLVLKPRGAAAAAAADQKAAVSLTPHPARYAEAPEATFEQDRPSSPLRPVVVAIAAAAALILVWRVGYLQGRNELMAAASGAPQAPAPVVDPPLTAALSARVEPDVPLLPEPLSSPKSPLAIEPTPEDAPPLEVAPVSASEPASVEEPTTVAAAELAPAPVEASLYLQISASGMLATAETLAQELASQGFVASIVSADDGLHRIVVGPFMDRESAQGPAEDLRALGYQPFPKTF